MTHSFCIKWSLDAKRDIYENSMYIKNKLYAPEAAVNLERRIRARVSALSVMPELYPKVHFEPLLSMGVRWLSEGNYTVYYFPDLEQRVITVLRVVYSGRDPERIVKNIVNIIINSL